MKKSTVPYSINRRGYHLFLEKIPAYVCSRCGQKYFDENESKAIQNLLKSFEKKLDLVIAA